MRTRMVVILSVLMNFHAVTCAQTFTPAGRDPRSAPAKKHELPTQVVLHVENIEREPGSVAAAKRLAEIESAMKTANNDERKKLEAESESLLNRGVFKASGYMAAIADGQGRFNDRSPSPTYYLIGTAEITKANRTKEFSVGDYLLIPDAVGGESIGRATAYCVCKRPANVVDRPIWWVDRPIEFRPPWEGVTSQSLKLTGEWNAEQFKEMRAGADTQVEATIKVVNSTGKPISSARICVRLLDEKGHTITQLDVRPLKPLPRRNYGEQGKGDPTLGAKAMTISFETEAITVKNVAAGDACRIPVSLRFSDAKATSRIEVFATYVE